MKPTAITVWFKKGGVGKSTLVSLLGVGLAENGARVAIIDADTQGSQAGIFDLVDEDGRIPEALHKVMKRELDPWLALVRVPDTCVPKREAFERGALYVLPGGPLTESAARDISNNPVQYRIADTLRIIAQPIEALSGKVDYVVIDLGPSNRTLTGAVLAATDFLLVPTVCDYLSVSQIASVFDEVALYREVNPRLELLGIVPMMVEHYPGLIARKSNNYRAGMELLQSTYADWLLPEVPKRNAWQDVMWTGHTILTDATADRKAVDDARRLLSAIYDLLGEAEYA